jgi:hypothetical protein
VASRFSSAAIFSTISAPIVGASERAEADVMPSTSVVFGVQLSRTHGFYRPNVAYLLAGDTVFLSSTGRLCLPSNRQLLAGFRTVLSLLLSGDIDLGSPTRLDSQL